MPFQVPLEHRSSGPRDEILDHPAALHAGGHRRQQRGRRDGQHPENEIGHNFRTQPTFGHGLEPGTRNRPSPGSRRHQEVRGAGLQERLPGDERRSVRSFEALREHRLQVGGLYVADVGVPFYVPYIYHGIYIRKYLYESK